jgi:hypothetical protein
LDVVKLPNFPDGLFLVLHHAIPVFLFHRILGTSLYNKYSLACWSDSRTATSQSLVLSWRPQISVPFLQFIAASQIEVAMASSNSSTAPPFVFLASPLCYTQVAAPLFERLFFSFS